MAYAYPWEFSTEERARIDAEKIRAIRAFRAAKRNLKSNPLIAHLGKIDAIITLIATIAAEFGSVACEYGNPTRIFPIHQSRWTVDRIGNETLNFVRYAGAELFNSLLHMNVVDADGGLSQEYTDRILETEIWDAFEQMRTEVADAQSQLPPAPLWNDDTPLPPLLPIPQMPRLMQPTAAKLRQLRSDSRQTLKQVAVLLHEADPENQWDVSTVYRHESGNMTPQPWRVSVYERVWSKYYGEKILIPVTPIKRKATQ